ncbi:flagellar protein FliT [Peribacillus psychrosaccharolyticus]|uniref:Flagellar protein FliT n=1 Tax=Peribacillus psychrosaccharolyticus TaxID=1407 RepID=A0A974RZ84_PERPY|nr:flagellar protein FliT [Peribacillus psychrosaccharolyticus]MEC2055494.1 flagellar protein FliT [Peribacillus psychrosaccharolyticus]MED3743478.1 flagellar protein FliT [Peribacillus psychrosaccharolyticus]QQS99170.1 flagellar protein FliT [Peribacillus psychrosaccharolyticus]
MEAVKKFHDLTEQLLAVLEQSSKEKRDETIGLVHELLSKRDEALANISPPFSAEDTVIGRNTVALNKRLTRLMDAEKTAIQRDLKQLSMKKESSDKYVNPYQNIMGDGMFYDKKN